MALYDTIPFSFSDLDRAAQLRNQSHEMRASPKARLIVARGDEVALTADGTALAHWPAAEGPEGAIFLGLRGDVPWFAAREAPEGVHLNLTPMRSVLSTLSLAETGVIAAGSAILNWHETHQFCANCGAPTEMRDGGWRRKCVACGHSHFPRTDPVVIMLVTEGENVLLGRSPGWPEGMYSLLAGFVEPGEPPEAAVAREVLEETNIRVTDMRYLASQPWPFPMSLMIGMKARALNTEITVDPAELEDALWVSRQRLGRIMRGEDTTILPARRGAIAHFLLEKWLAGAI